MKLEFVTITSQELLNYVTTKAQVQNVPVFRFNTLINYGIPLSNLGPLQDTMRFLAKTLSEEDNGEAYNQYLYMYNDQLVNYKPSFYDLMQFMCLLQIAPQIIILTDYNNEFIMNIVESLITIINERYSLNSFIVKDIDDIDPLAYSEFSSEEGYTRYIQDIERYISYKPANLPKGVLEL